MGLYVIRDPGRTDSTRSLKGNGKVMGTLFPESYSWGLIRDNETVCRNHVPNNVSGLGVDRGQRRSPSNGEECLEVTTDWDQNK